MWQIGAVLKHCKVPNNYDQDCRSFELVIKKKMKARLLNRKNRYLHFNCSDSREANCLLFLGLKSFAFSGIRNIYHTPFRKVCHMTDIIEMQLGETLK